jgi:hypothetical protein
VRNAKHVTDMPPDEVPECGGQTTAAAVQLGELVRYLSFVTAQRPEQALPDPNTAAAVLSALHSTCTLLPHLLEQLAGRMRALTNDPLLATRCGDAQALAERSAASLRAARPAVRGLALALGKAHQAADRLYLDGNAWNDLHSTGRPPPCAPAIRRRAHQ